MSKRICDECGEEKPVAGGKTCETGHFICRECYNATGGFFKNPDKNCPLCGKPLR